jgi:hypothetical protein
MVSILVQISKWLDNVISIGVTVFIAILWFGGSLARLPTSALVVLAMVVLACVMNVVIMIWVP